MMKTNDENYDFQYNRITETDYGEVRLEEISPEYMQYPILGTAGSWHILTVEISIIGNGFGRSL